MSPGVLPASPDKRLLGGTLATAWRPGTGERLLHNRARPESMGTTTNIAELMPEIPTPLGWSVFAPSAELAMRRAFRSLGALNAGEVQFPLNEEDLVTSIFTVIDEHRLPLQGRRSDAGRQRNGDRRAVLLLHP